MIDSKGAGVIFYADFFRMVFECVLQEKFSFMRKKNRLSGICELACASETLACARTKGDPTSVRNLLSRVK
jgi:hypothetical protein